jgi:hypothetical protein
MIDYKKTRKIISIMVIVAFVCHFHSDIFLHAQETDELLTLINKATIDYNNGQYKDSKDKIELVIGIITEEGLDNKDILGSCYLLLGAIYEKEGKAPLAQENYRRAKDEYGIIKIYGIDLDRLPIYKKIVKEGIIEKDGKKRKKKFPVLLVVAFGVGVAIGAIFVKPKKKK